MVESRYNTCQNIEISINAVKPSRHLLVPSNNRNTSSKLSIVFIVMHYSGVSIVEFEQETFDWKVVNCCMLSEFKIQNTWNQATISTQLLKVCISILG